MFSDHSDINPKVVVGFIAFAALILYALTDVVTGAFGKEFVIKDTIFNGLIFVICGCFSISGVEAIFGNKNLKKDENANTDTK